MDNSPTAPQPMTVEQARAWAAAWGRADPELAAERHEKSRRVPIWEAIAALDDAFEAALARRGLRDNSGFVEQQRLFARLR
jgi:hypothetical protein